MLVEQRANECEETNEEVLKSRKWMRSRRGEVRLFNAGRAQCQER
jgi:hypothetical protein